MMRTLLRYFLSLSLIFSAAISIALTNNEESRQAQFALNRGRFAEFIKHWENTLSTLSPNQKIEVSVRLAEAYQSLGFTHQAQKYLEQALPLTQHPKDKIRKSLVLGGLSDVHLFQHDLEKAEHYAKQSVDLARQSSSALAYATALNYQGNVLSVQENYSEALTKYQTGLEQLRQEDDAMLRAKLLGNLVQIELKVEPAHLRHFDEALSQFRSLPNSHDKIFGLIKLGYFIQSKNTHQAKIILQEALTLAQQLLDNIGMIYATGYLGEVYEREKKYVEAEKLTQQAISLTQQHDVSTGFCATADDVSTEFSVNQSVSSAPELMYHWQWQLGRLKKSQCDLEGALVAYQKAADHLQCIQTMMIQCHDRHPPQSFYETAGKVYFELADLQLQLAHSVIEESLRQSKLQEARETLERLKVTELKNYFREDCLTVTKYKRIDEVLKNHDHTAVLYPMIFLDRVELILSLHGSLKQFQFFSEEVKEINQIIEDFLEQLKKPNNIGRWHRRDPEELSNATKLYNVFIKPIEQELDKIDTLVIVPDKLLRTIPFAAFYDFDIKDGKGKFLVEKYALAIIPGLSLVEPQTLKKDHLNLLAAGLSTFEQGFEALGDASTAIIQGIEQKKFCQDISLVSLTDEKFNRKELEQTLNRTAYTIVSFDTHASFNKNAQESFLLLARGDRLTLNDLEKLFFPNLFRKEPVELLTLSACETAKGDEQAALGLAGLTVKLGVRSVVGSLWKVDNKGTEQLMETFFRNLCDHSSPSKAQALQEAQKELLKKWPHPYYWAAFLLMGNWL